MHRARNLGEDRYIGLEYYAGFGKIGDFLPLGQQSQQFAVTDFKVSRVDVELGAGYGLTPGSDRFVLKAILGYAFRYQARAATAQHFEHAFGPPGHTSTRVTGSAVDYGDKFN